MHKLERTPAFGAAVMAAKKINRVISQQQNPTVFDVLFNKYDKME
ncbi:unnamed protein product [Enterobius vermicularis]|uniref:Transcriptional regulator n=1 Tax=Enterobius vermicularis TaxID=51028 RepID=A0A0N4V3J9_ENTVE|nr:unnamed protein product [Enterobius vermicularis]